VSHQFDLHRAGTLDRLIVGIGDNHAHSRLAAGEIRLLADHVHHWRAKHLREGFDASDGWLPGIAVADKPIAHAVPYQFIERHGTVQLELFLPHPVPLADVGVFLEMPDGYIFGIQNVHGKLSLAGFRS
jgi:hypothetical protein